MDKMKFETPDMTAENVEKIAALFPNCVTETKGEDGKIKRGINFELLKQMLSPDVVEGKERYEFTWVGKKASIVEANKPIRKTLRPCLEESKNWDTTENLYIEGDNLEVLKLLQESYLGKVKMIYIDPPYNTGNDFIYADDFTRSQKEENEQMGMYDEENNRLFKNTDSNGRFHSDWCSMIYSRLMLARNLLADDGVIFISIDDNEQENLKKICDEIFGRKNFITEIPRLTSAQRPSQERYVSIQHDYITIYKKDKNNDSSFARTVQRKGMDKIKEDNIGLYFEGDTSPILASATQGYSSGGDYDFEYKGIIYRPIASDGSRRRWLWTIDRMRAAANLGILVPTENGLRVQNYINKEFQTKTNIMVDKDANLILATYDFMQPLYANNHGTAILNELALKFSFSKPINLIKEIIKLLPDREALIVDFFSGSATTAHAVMQLNAEDGGHRKFIMVQLPEKCDEQSEAYKAGYKNICEIGKERIRRAGEKIKAENPLTTQDLDVGFRVLKLDDSNMKDVYYSADEYTQSNLFDMVSNIKDDRTDLDLLFGCLLDWGLPLSMPYTSEKISGGTVHTYNNGDLIACFDENIPESIVKEIARRKPLRAVFRDSGFASSPSKINVFEIFKLYMPEDADDITKRVRVI